MILKGHSNVNEEKGNNCHGGIGKFSVRTLLEKEFESNLAYVRELVLLAGSSIGVHQHRDDEEIYYIISGSGIMVVDGEEKCVKAGDIVLTKSGSSHGLINNSNDTLKLFVACAKL